MGTKGRNRRELTATEAAVRLRMSRERLIRLIQTGEVAGRRDPLRGWLIEPTALQRLERAVHHSKKGRVSDA